MRFGHGHLSLKNNHQEQDYNDSKTRRFLYEPNKGLTLINGPNTKNSSDEKPFLAFIVGGMLLNADALNDKVENLMGERAYHTNKLFLERLFKNRKAFYVMGRLDSLKLLNTLKENGLLSFNFDKPNMLKITFKASSNPLAFAKSINNSLNMMGYSYVLPIKMQSSFRRECFFIRS